MNIVKTCLTSLTFVLTISALQAQTADQIIDKYLDAIGGKEKLKTINTVRTENAMQIMGNDAPSTTIILNGKGVRTESDFNGQKIIQVYSDKGGWMINPMMGSDAPQSIPPEQLKGIQSQLYAVPFLDYADRGSKAEYLGQEKVGNVDAYKIKLTDKDSGATTFYFDPSTYYLIQMVRPTQMMGNTVDMIITYSDFKKTDFGWVVPNATDFNMGGQFSFTAKLKNVEINKEVDPKIFEMPAK